MRYFIIIIFSIFSIISFAQKNEDVIVELEPHRLDEYFKKDNHSGIKKVYTISKNKKTNFANDTLNVDLYNEQGLKIQTVRYEKNSPASNLQFIYDDNRNHVKSIYTQNKVKERTSITEYKYDSNNQLIEEDNQSMFAGSLERTVTKKYKYIDGKLVEKSIYQNNTLNQINSFFYDNDNLILHQQIYLSGNNNYENTYIYDGSGKLIQRETKAIYTPNNTTELIGIVKYQYENEKLTSVIESEWQNFKNNESVLASYSYNENNKLSKMRVEYKSFFREVNYEYSNQKKVTINVVTNTDNSAYMKFWTSTFGNYIEKMPFNYKEQFDHDEKENLISKKIFINDELIYEVNYIIEYY